MQVKRNSQILLFNFYDIVKLVRYVVINGARITASEMRSNCPLSSAMQFLWANSEIK